MIDTADSSRTANHKSGATTGQHYSLQPKVRACPEGVARQTAMTDDNTTSTPTEAQHAQLVSPFNARNRIKFFGNGGDDE